jgi:hypothetical protein
VPSLRRGRVCNLQCTRWLVRSLRTNSHTLPSHLRLCSLFVASYDSQGLQWRHSNPSTLHWQIRHNRQIILSADFSEECEFLFWGWKINYCKSVSETASGRIKDLWVINWEFINFKYNLTIIWNPTSNTAFIVTLLRCIYVRKDIIGWAHSMNGKRYVFRILRTMKVMDWSRQNVQLWQFISTAGPSACFCSNDYI